MSIIIHFVFSNCSGILIVFSCIFYLTFFICVTVYLPFSVTYYFTTKFISAFRGTSHLINPLQTRRLAIVSF